MLRRLLVLLLPVLLSAFAGKPLPLPAGWPLPQLAPPTEAHTVPLSRLAPADRPYYLSGNDDSYQPAREALERLLAPVHAADSGVPADAVSFANLPGQSVDGSTGRSWGIAFKARGGWDSALAQCEFALKPLNFEIQDYRPGRLRTYYSRDRRTEVTLVAAKDDRLLLCVLTYDPPLPSERELAQRDDLQHAAREIAEQIRSRALEIAAGK